MQLHILCVCERGETFHQMYRKEEMVPPKKEGGHSPYKCNL